MMEVAIIHTISLFERFFPTGTQSFRMKINVQSASESSLCDGWVQKQVKSLKSSEVYLCINIKYVRVMTEGSTWKMTINSKMQQEFSASVGPWLSEQ